MIFENEYAKLDRVTFELPDGNEHDYFIHGKPAPVASVFAMTEDERIILAREYRPGPDVILDELPGGIMDEGEEPLDAAKRELLEETGYEGDMKLLGRTYMSAYSPKLKYCFLATNCKKVAEPAGDVREFIDVVLKTKEEFMEQVEKGELTDLETALWVFRVLET